MKDNKDLVIAVLPEGIKDMGDVFESQEFKNFMKSQSRYQSNILSNEINLFFRDR